MERKRERERERGRERDNFSRKCSAAVTHAASKSDGARVSARVLEGLCLPTPVRVVVWALGGGSRCEGLRLVLLSLELS